MPDSLYPTYPKEYIEHLRDIAKLAQDLAYSRKLQIDLLQLQIEQLHTKIQSLEDELNVRHVNRINPSYDEWEDIPF